MSSEWRRWSGVPVQFEGVGAVSVCGFLLQVAGQVDDRQRSERTFLQTKTERDKSAGSSDYNEGSITGERPQVFSPWCRCRSLYTETLRSRRSYSVESPRYTVYLHTHTVQYMLASAADAESTSELWRPWDHSPIRTTGQLFLHSWRHFLGLHLSWLTMAILVFLSAIVEDWNDGR